MYVVQLYLASSSIRLVAKSSVSADGGTYLVMFLPAAPSTFPPRAARSAGRQRRSPPRPAERRRPHPRTPTPLWRGAGSSWVGTTAARRGRTRDVPVPDAPAPALRAQMERYPGSQVVSPDEEGSSAIPSGCFALNR